MEVGRAHFETKKTRFTILDAPVSGTCNIVIVVGFTSKSS